MSHHLRKLADVGFVTMRKEGTSTVVAMSPTCCVALPQAADVVMGVLAPRPCCPSDLPDDVSVRAMIDDDWDAVRRIYGEGIDTRNATFAAEVPSREHLHERWLPQHRWVATIGGVVVGWAALSPVSERDCYRGGCRELRVRCGRHAWSWRRKGVVAQASHGRRRDGLWTLQTSMFPESRAPSRSIIRPGFERSAFARRSPNSTACGATLFCSSVERRSPRDESGIRLTGCPIAR